MTVPAARRLGILILAVLLTASSLPSDKPEAVGLSSERLQRINQMIQRYIDGSEITGAITMVSRRGKVAHFEAQGQMDLEKKAPMRTSKKKVEAAETVNEAVATEAPEATATETKAAETKTAETRAPAKANAPAKAKAEAKCC